MVNSRNRKITNPDFYWTDLSFNEDDPNRTLVEVYMIANYFEVKPYESSEGTEIVIFNHVGLCGGNPGAMPIDKFEKVFSPVLKRDYKLGKSKVN